jgi:hypothetical protein
MRKLIEEYTRLLAPLEAEAAKHIESRYRAAFPSDPLPMLYWHRGYGPQLERLMEEAILRGGALTVDDLLKAQDTDPPPPEALV